MSISSSNSTLQCKTNTVPLPHNAVCFTPAADGSTAFSNQLFSQLQHHLEQKYCSHLLPNDSSV